MEKLISDPVEVYGVQQQDELTHLLCFMLHDVIKQSKASADELLADYRSGEKPGTGLHVHGPQHFIQQDSYILLRQTAWEHWLNKKKQEVTS